MASLAVAPTVAYSPSTSPASKFPLPSALMAARLPKFPASIVPPMEVRMFTAARVGPSGSSFLLHPARASVAASVAANRVLVFILFLFLI